MHHVKSDNSISAFYSRSPGPIPLLMSLCVTVQCLQTLDSVTQSSFVKLAEL